MARLRSFRRAVFCRTLDFAMLQRIKSVSMIDLTWHRERKYEPCFSRSCTTDLGLSFGLDADFLMSSPYEARLAGSPDF